MSTTTGSSIILQQRRNHPRRIMLMYYFLIKSTSRTVVGCCFLFLAALSTINAFTLTPSCSRTTLVKKIMPSPARTPLHHYLYRTPISPASQLSVWNLDSKLLLSSNDKNQWENDIITISPDLSEYFAKQTEQQQTTSSSSSSDNIDTTVSKSFVPSPATTLLPEVPPSLFVDNENGETVDDVNTENIDSTATVREILTTLQSTIEKGNAKTSNMISDIIISIQRLQRIQQQRQNNYSKNISKENDDKLILMKNPKKRSSNVSAKKGGMGKSSSIPGTTSTESKPQSSSSSSSSAILQRLQQLGNSNDGEISYRLLWVGSDETISAFGTGLHRVPLARLQEVFLSISLPQNIKKSKLNNRFRITTTEVIRIIGPFPNIKNTLQGVCTITTSSSLWEQWNISWDSMIDGTGKELISKENDARIVPTLHMIYGDEQMIVASIVSSSATTNTDMTSSTTITPLQPEAILLFERELDMDTKLSALRVI